MLCSVSFTRLQATYTPLLHHTGHRWDVQRKLGIRLNVLRRAKLYIKHPLIHTTVTYIVKLQEHPHCLHNRCNFHSLLYTAVILWQSPFSLCFFSICGIPPLKVWFFLFISYPEQKLIFFHDKNKKGWNLSITTKMCSGFSMTKKLKKLSWNKILP